MNRHLGAESVLGHGGKMVNAASTASLNKAEKLISRGPVYYRQALEILKVAVDQDAANLDAILVTVSLLKDDSVRLKLLQDSEKQGKLKLLEVLGSTTFDDGGEYVGRFWDVLETRPYMRVRKEIAQIAYKNKDYKLACDTRIESLRLCPDDNQSNRESVVPLLLHCDRPFPALVFSISWLRSYLGAGTLPKGGCAFKSTRRSQVDPACPDGSKLSDEIAKGRGCSTRMHDGALSAYLTFGDCVLARKFLTMGALGNRHTLSRILSKTPIPESPNSSPRSPNGPEDAQDYLWMSQEFWNKPDVWAWADSVKEAKIAILRKCSRPDCGKTERHPGEWKQCAGCKDAWYCSTECQTAHWKPSDGQAGHKTDCNQRQQLQRQIPQMYQARMQGGPLPENTYLADRHSGGYTTFGLDA